MRGGWGCPLAHPVRGRGTVAHGPHSGPLRSHERWDQGTGPWCETSRKHPHGLVVGTRQGWVEAGIFAPPGGAGLRQRMILGPCPPGASRPHWAGKDTTESTRGQKVRGM